MLVRKRWLCAAASVAALVAATLPPLASADAAGGLPPRAVRQIAALTSAKDARTAFEGKLDTSLLTALQQRQGVALPDGVRVTTVVPKDGTGRVVIDVRGTVDSRVLERIRSVGGLVSYTSRAHGLVRAAVPLAGVSRLAALPQVVRVDSMASRFITASMRDPGAPSATPQTPAEKTRAADVRQRIVEAEVRRTTSRHPGPASSRRLEQSAGVGVVTSEGDRVLGVDVARATRHLSGVGVTVGVLSDGVDSLTASIATGDLPPDVQVLPDSAGSGDEGTAMLEIVHDLAPKAALMFATASNSAESFADNIRALRAAGADVIVDDVLYFAESPFQDGPVAQAVQSVISDGAIYLSSAGNEGNVDDRTSGNYEADFRSSGLTVGKFGGAAHDFDPGPNTQIVNPTTPGSAGTPVILQWADPLGAARDDYDLYALDAADNVVAFSNAVQDGDDDPFEGFFLPAGAVGVVVVKDKGAPRYFQLTVFRGRFGGGPSLTPFATPGVTRGHSAVRAAVSVAAVPAASPLPFDIEAGDPPNPSGPFPERYGQGQLTERFTSDGPRHVFFTPTGRPLTPDDFSSTGGRVRSKPDVAAADGVSTSVSGFEQFFGTSASAPHAAAIAALALSGSPGIQPSRVRAALTATAVDIEREGPDRDTGAGIIDAPAVMAAVAAEAQPFAVGGSATVVTSTDGDSFLEPGEQATVAVPVLNEGDAPATGVVARVRALTPGIGVSPAERGYGTVAAGAGRRRTFTVSVPETVPLGTTLGLEETVLFVGGNSPQTSTGSIVVGEPSRTVVTSTYAGPPVPIPDRDPDGASLALPVSGVGPLSEVTFSIDGTSCDTAEGSVTVGLDHPFVGDLVGTLTSPGGTDVDLFSRVGGTGNNVCQALFTDAADRGIEIATADDAPFTGSWQPAEPLSTLEGAAGDGLWHFTVADAASRDTGSIRGVSLHVRGFAPSP